MKLLKLRQIENGKEFYVNPDEIASVNPVSKLTAEVIIGKDNTINYTLLTLKNGVKINAKETPYQIAWSGIAEVISPYGAKNNEGPSGPKADDTAKPGPTAKGYEAGDIKPWSPEANLERSKKVSHTVGGAAPVK